MVRRRRSRSRARRARTSPATAHRAEEFLWIGRCAKLCRDVAPSIAAGRRLAHLGRAKSAASSGDWSRINAVAASAAAVFRRLRRQSGHRDDSTGSIERKHNNGIMSSSARATVRRWCPPSRRRRGWLANYHWLRTLTGRRKTTTDIRRTRQFANAWGWRRKDNTLRCCSWEITGRFGLCSIN